MLKFIDNFLNKITMYRLVLYYLIAIIGSAAILASFGLLPYSPIFILVTAAFITLICLVVNFIFSRVFEAPVNVESAYITGLILALIIPPPTSLFDGNYLVLAVWASIWAMASKYIFAIGKKHIFNPAAFALVLTAFAIDRSANWWVGILPLTPIVLIGGLLIARKIKRSDLVASFFIGALISIIMTTYAKGLNTFASLENGLLHTPILFFAFVMLTEPLTSPPKRTMRMFYGVLTGLIFAPSIHIGSVYSTPELALVIGNVFSYLVSPKEKLMLKLNALMPIANDTYDFLFVPDRALKFKPGQYLEWTLAHKNSDTRGNRRYFTIASSPTENKIRMGVKIYPKASSFKSNLALIKKGDVIVASQLAGEFTLPDNKNKKLVFIAGGIGITPFRSMTKYLLDKNEKRDIVLMYSNKTIGDIAYKDVFDQAGQRLGIKTVYNLTDANQIPLSWQGKIGPIDANMILNEVPDYKDRTFYLSGPRSMVVSFDEVLRAMGVKRSNIKKDFFPGFV